MRSLTIFLLPKKHKDQDTNTKKFLRSILSNNKIVTTQISVQKEAK